MCTGEILAKEIYEAKLSGLYSTASIEMFEQIDKIEVSDKILSHLDYTNELLIDYLNDILELKDSRPGKIEFLRVLKDYDVMDNHGLERENSFLLGLYSQIPRDTAMERLIRYYKNGKQLTGKNLMSVHNTLLYGTSSEDDELIRTRNDKFVGGIMDGQLFIDYFPMDYRDIREAADKLANLYNSRLSNNGFDNVFFQPFLVHGLIAALQMFNDGNTRLGRVMQHALIWQLINEKWHNNQLIGESKNIDSKELIFELPPVYATRSYYPLRHKYREIIAMLVKENNSQVWNKWFDFNLDRIEDSLDVGRENIKMLKRKIEFGKK